MNWLWLSLYHAVAMFWETLWALVLGFSLSAFVQVFVSKAQMTRAFGKADLRSVAIATGLGAAQEEDVTRRLTLPLGDAAFLLEVFSLSPLRAVSHPGEYQ